MASYIVISNLVSITSYTKIMSIKVSFSQNMLVTEDCMKLKLADLRIAWGKNSWRNDDLRSWYLQMDGSGGTDSI